MSAIKNCVGCGKNEALFQCPLCQAEEAEGEGYFCSQECFGKNWLGHRDNVHAGGTVRAGAKRKRDEPAEEPKTRSKSSGKKDAKAKGAQEKAAPAEEDPVVEAPAPAVCPPWAGLPPFSDCRESGWAVVSPQVTSETPKAVIRVPFTGDSEQFLGGIFWTTAIAATEMIRTLIATTTTEFVVVCGSPITAHAFAWAVRCAGLSRHTKLVLSTADEDMRKKPVEHFAPEAAAAEGTANRPAAPALPLRVVITSTSVLRCVQGEKKSLTNISEWMDGRTLVTMPDVEDPENLQSINSKAWYFVSRPTQPATSTTPFKALDQFEEDELDHHISALVPLAFQSPVKIMDIGTRFDNEVSTCLARGNLKGFLERIVNIFSNSKNRCEEVLTNALLCDWGCIGGDANVAHHKIAYIMRYLVDHSDKFANSSISLAQIAVRTACRVAKVLPPIPVSKKASELTNLFLQATVCYCFELLSAASVDSLGTSWGFDKVLEGATTLSNVNKARAELVARIRSRYGAQLGTKYGDFLVILMHLLYDAVSVWALTREEVDRATQFSALLAHEAGPLDKFLVTCDLSGPRADAAKAKSLLSKTKTSVTALSDTSLIRPSNTKYVCPLAFTPLPLSGRRQRAVDRLKSAAIDEILSAMPRLPLPMYIGDVGNLIGIWTKFNSKYDGALGYTLSEFLETNPEHFTVVGNLVTRVKAGTSDPVRVRFDNDIEDGSDDDDDTRKRRDRENLTGLGKKGKKQPVHHSAKARKKAEKKQRNADRYNRNHIKFDPEKKVPGYVKHGPRKLKGRGRKANIRTTKRSA